MSFDGRDPFEATSVHRLLPTPFPAAQEDDRILLAVAGPEAGAVFPLREVTVLGRGPECDVPLRDSSISRRHARLRRCAGPVLLLEDLGSRNGTCVNGRPVTGSWEVHTGDRVELGARTALLITRHDPLESMLRQRQKMEAIGRMAAGVAHDFNNLMGAAITTLHALERRVDELAPGDPEAGDCVADLRSALDRAADLTRGLATLGRRQERRPAELLEVAEVCGEVERLCRRTFDAQIQIEVAAQDGLVVLGDRTELHQVLLNLCLNARDAMPGGGRLRLSASGSRNVVTLVVADTGAGMDDDTVAHVFEPFFTTKPDGRGSGLGLATVAELVRGMGGQIEVDSRLGQGTRFRIELERHRDAPPARPAPPPVEPASTLARSVRGRILVVDDQDLVRRGIGRVVRSIATDVLYARNGTEALAVARRSHPPLDLVILDLDMPDMGGEEVLEELVQAGGRRPAILIVSGHWDPARKRAALNAGADAFLGKPFDAAELRAEAARLLRARSGGASP